MPGRIGIGLFATLVLFPVGGPYEAPADVGPLEVAAELLVGLLAGFAITLIFGAVQFMAGLIGVNSGFSFAQTLNPMFDGGGGAGGVVETFIMAFALLVFVQINGHHLFLIGLMQLFEVVPVGEITRLPGLAGHLARPLLWLVLGRAQAGAAGPGSLATGGPGPRAARSGRPAVQPVRAGDAGQDAARADRPGAGAPGHRAAPDRAVPDRAFHDDGDRRRPAALAASRAPRLARRVRMYRHRQVLLPTPGGPSDSAELPVYSVSMTTAVLAPMDGGRINQGR